MHLRFYTNLFSLRKQSLFISFLALSGCSGLTNENLLLDPSWQATPNGTNQSAQHSLPPPLLKPEPIDQTIGPKLPDMQRGDLQPKNAVPNTKALQQVLAAKSDLSAKLSPRPLSASPRRGLSVSRYVVPSLTNSERALKPAALTGPRFCALTFDDGPHALDNSILDTLKKHHIKATFFLVGRTLKHQRLHAIVQRMHREGHEIGVHSQTHPNFKHLNLDQQRKELLGPIALIREINPQIRVATFRPPYGNYNKKTIDLAKEYGLEIVNWNVDSQDWKLKNKDLIVAEVTQQSQTYRHPLILLHSIHQSSLDSLDRIILNLKSQCNFVTVSTWLSMLEGPKPLL